MRLEIVTLEDLPEVPDMDVTVASIEKGMDLAREQAHCRHDGTQKCTMVLRHPKGDEVGRVEIAAVEEPVLVLDEEEKKEEAEKSPKKKPKTTRKPSRRGSGGRGRR